MGITASLVLQQGAQQVLAPVNDIIFPSSSSAQNPLQFAGANSPYFAGPNVNNIDLSDNSDTCYVNQAAYVVRHGSRFPDTGAYNGWVALQQKIQIAVNGTGFQARDSLAFIKDWKPVLTNKTPQMAQESMTGWKEASDLGYQLRARYPTFYEDGNPYHVWANAYSSPVNKSRVVQTARAFLHGYLYEFVDEFGTVISVNSTGSPDATGNSLGPSDSCPKFAATASGGNNVTDWNAIWTPQAVKRINSMVSGNLTFTSSDILSFPYLCGFESQITGRLSPWCDVFTDEELRSYAYTQDLSYYYSTGPGSDGPASILFLPFLEELLTVLSTTNGDNGVPKLIMAFLNDNQIAELTAAMGLFDAEPKLPSDHIPAEHLYQVSHFITMRGTVAFEVLACGDGKDYLRILLNDAVYPIPNCKNGPGGSCLLSQYLSMISAKSTAAGSFLNYCNVSASARPSRTINTPAQVAGASFFTDLSLNFLSVVKP